MALCLLDSPDKLRFFIFPQLTPSAFAFSFISTTFIYCPF
jgi:hypothetical protein